MPRAAVGLPFGRVTSAPGVSTILLSQASNTNEKGQIQGGFLQAEADGVPPRWEREDWGPGRAAQLVTVFFEYIQVVSVSGQGTYKNQPMSSSVVTGTANLSLFPPPSPRLPPFSL